MSAGDRLEQERQGVSVGSALPAYDDTGLVSIILTTLNSEQYIARVGI